MAAGGGFNNLAALAAHSLEKGKVKCEEIPVTRKKEVSLMVDGGLAHHGS